MIKTSFQIKNIWEKVLIEFERAGFYQNGLTLPFLIGAIAYFRPNEPKIDIHQTIVQMCSNPRKVSLIYCNGIEEPVFSMLDPETEQLLNKSPQAFKRFESLIIVDGSMVEIISVTALIEYFVNRYKKHIELREFSKNGHWGAFNQVDIENLEHVRAFLH